MGYGIRDDAVPNDGLVVGGHVDGRRAVGIGPFGRHPDEDLLSVPAEQAGQVGVEVEADVCVLGARWRVPVAAAFESAWRQD